MTKKIKKRSTASRSEVHAYRFIYDELIKKGWNKEQIFTQQECQKIDDIKVALGLKTPENVVIVKNGIYYIIESKNERKKLNLAITEAREYADLVNDKKAKGLFITGVAGSDEEGFIAKSQFLVDGKWETITENEVEVTSLLSVLQVEDILKNSNSNIADVEISEEEFLAAAERINDILHENSIHKDYRARFISALLLALSDGSDLNLDETDVSVLISTINAKVDAILNRHRKREFSRFIKIDEPSSSDNHIKVKAAIIKTSQELLGLNIRSAMRSGKDILGQFYEVFLKYGNGAREIGIVLTPRHITRFAAEILDIKSNDLVYDPACGTGGFLVAAFDKIRREETNKNLFGNFKENGMYGVEEQDPVIALAIVNMIFRGDGKNNMIEGNCFNKWLTIDNSSGKVRAKYQNSDNQGRIAPITKVLMNPPFSQKGSKAQEYEFIEQALKQMQDDGLLFAVLPMSVLIEKAARPWRETMLKQNSLLAVIKFPDDLFYPTGTVTIGIVIKKGIPQPKDQKVYWARIKHDGFIKKKGKRVRSTKTKDDLLSISESLKEFIADPSIKIKNVPEFQKASEVDFEDKQLELVPEAYLDEKTPSQEEIENNIDQLMRETASFLIRTKEVEEDEN